jgi:hypothetical protein
VALAWFVLRLWVAPKHEVLPAAEPAAREV